MYNISDETERVLVTSLLAACVARRLVRSIRIYMHSRKYLLSIEEASISHRRSRKSRHCLAKPSIAWKRLELSTLTVCSLLSNRGITKEDENLFNNVVATARYFVLLRRGNTLK